MLTAFILTMLAAPVERTGPMDVTCVKDNYTVYQGKHVVYFSYEPATGKGYSKTESGAETWFTADTCEVHR